MNTEKKFVMVNTSGWSAERILNELGTAGWGFFGMKPFFQDSRSTSAHGISKMLVCLTKNKNSAFHYRVRLLKGNGNGNFQFRADDFTEYTAKMRNCGFELMDFHHIIVLHLQEGYSSRRAMKGYFCIWKIELERFAAGQMHERIIRITNIIKQDPSFQGNILQHGNDTSIINKKLYTLIKQINRLDDKELKRQMGKDWDNDLKDVKPDIDDVAAAVGLSDNPEKMVEEIMWCSMGSLMKIATI